MTIQTRFGEVNVVVRDGTVVRVELGRFAPSDAPAAIAAGRGADSRGREIAERMIGYFEGEGDTLSGMTASPEGTAWQRAVWAATREVPFGRSTTYGELARQVGPDSNGARAVGAALNRNPLPLLIPCHRVVSTTGELTGFAAGLAWKRALLSLEAPQYALAL